MDELKLWCCVEGDRSYFQLYFIFDTIFHLKKRIYDEKDKSFNFRCNAADLILTKVGYITIFM